MVAAEGDGKTMPSDVAMVLDAEFRVFSVGGSDVAGSGGVEVLRAGAAAVLEVPLGVTRGAGAGAESGLAETDTGVLGEHIW